MKMRTLLSASAVVVLVGLAAFELRFVGWQPKHEGGAVAQSAAALPLRTALRPTVVTAIGPADRERSPAPSNGDDPTPTTKRPNRESPNGPTPLTLEDQVRYVETNFEKEAIDPSWARETRQTLTDSFQKSLPTTSAIRSVDCRTTICRAEIAHAGEAEYQRFMNDSKGAWKGPIMMTRAEQKDGEWTMLVLAGKPGTQLALLE